MKHVNHLPLSLICVNVKNIVYHDLLHIQDYKIQFNLSNNFFQLKLFDIAVTLKYGQGHYKQYKEIKLNE